MTRKCVLIIGTSDTQEYWLGDKEWQNGCDIVIARDAANGLKRALINHPDIVILDIGMPEREAMAIYQQIIERLPQDQRPAFILKPSFGVPVVITPEGQNIPPELLSKLDGNGNSESLMPIAQLAKADGPTAVACHGIELDAQKFVAAVNNEKLDLTATEFRLLWTLASSPGRVFTRKHLAEACHGASSLSSGRSIDVHIRSVRKKLGDLAEVIETVWGVGYRFRDCTGEMLGDGKLVCSS